MTLLPWGDAARTKARGDGGANPRWSAKAHDAVMQLPYHGTPPEGTWPVLRVEVMDEEALRGDRLIGSAQQARRLTNSLRQT